MSAVPGLAQALGGGVSALADGLLSGAAEVAGQIADAGISAIGNMVDAASGVATNALSAATSTAESLLSTASNVGASVLDGIGSLAEAGLGEGGAIASGLVDFAGQAFESAAGLAGNGLEAAGELASGAIDLAGDIAQGVLDAASSTVDGLMEAVFGDSEELADTIQDACEGMGEVAEETKEECNKDNIEKAAEGGEPDEDEDEEESGNSGSEPGNQASGGEGEATDPDGESSSPISNPDNAPADTGLVLKEDKTKELGWKKIKNTSPISGVLAMMHDGDQQLFNPYSPNAAEWTMYSFRPKDRDSAEHWPQIAITPSSFEAISSMDTMLNLMPFVVVKEYFFKNTASGMASFVKKIMGMAKEAVQKPADNNEDEESSMTSGDVKKVGNKLLDKLKDKFENLQIEQMVVDIPYVLYCGLRAKTYGNTYIFPYIVQSGSTVINQASNEAEWTEPSGGLTGTIKGLIQSAANLAGGAASMLTGS